MASKTVKRTVKASTTKAAAIVAGPNQVIAYQPEFAVGDTVTYNSLPCVVTGIFQHANTSSTNSNVSYQVVGDIASNVWNPTAMGSAYGPFKNVEASSLTSR